MSQAENSHQSSGWESFKRIVPFNSNIRDFGLYVSWSRPETEPSCHHELIKDSEALVLQNTENILR